MAVLYFALALGWSWMAWLLVIIGGRELTQLPAVALYALGGLGPAIAGITLTYLSADPQNRRDYWRRIIEIQRIGARWYAVILLAVPLFTGMAALMDIVLGGRGGGLDTAAGLVNRPLAVIFYVPLILLFGPLPEELGWRGYVLDHLQTRWNAVASSLILGAVWAVWHLPQFFVRGTYQHGLGAGSLSFWRFMLELPVISILYTWIYNNTRRSTLSAILLHFMVNFTGQLVTLTARAEWLLFFLWIIAALTVTLVWGPRTLVRNPAARAGP